MAKNGSYVVKISAVDNMSAALNTINKRLAGLRAPFEKLSKQWGQFSKLSGLSGVISGLKKIESTARSAAGGLAAIVTPLGAISGAASLAGMYKLVSSWGDFGTKLLNTASNLGTTTSRLQQMQSAARLSGASAEAMSSGLEALGNNMQDAVAGRAPEVSRLLTGLGVDFKAAGYNAKSSAEVYPTLIARLRKIENPIVRMRIATQLLGGAAHDLMPQIMETAEAYEEHNREAVKYGVINEAGAKQANIFREAQTKVQLAVEGLGYSIAERLGPTISPLLTQFADWLATSSDVKDAIGWVGTKVHELADWIKTVDFKQIVTDIVGFAHRADDLAQSLGGWKVVLEGIIALKVAGWVASFIAPFASVGASIIGLIGKLSALKAARAAAAGVEVAEEAAGAGLGAVEGGAAAAGGAGLAATAAAAAGPAIALALAEKYLPHILSYATGQGYNDENATYKGASPNQRGSGSTGARRDAAAPSGRNAGAAQEAPHVRPTSAQAEGIYKDSWQYMMSTGTPKALAASILGSVRKESGGDARAVGDGGAAYGALQWHKDRQDQFREFSGHDIRGSTLHEQLDFAKWELSHKEKGSAGKGYNGTSDSLNSAVTAGNANEAGQIYSRNVIRPGMDDATKAAEARERGGYAADFASRYANLGAATAQGDRILPPVPTQTASTPPAPAPASNGVVSVNVNLNGMPDGASHSTSYSGDALAGAPRVRTSLPSMG